MSRMPIFNPYRKRRESAEDQDRSAMASTLNHFTLDQSEALSNSRLARQLSEESIRTELCEGPVSDSPPTRTPEDDASPPCSDRADLIERLKRGESPTWIPNRVYESIWSHEPLSPSRGSISTQVGSPTLLPPPTITPEKRNTETDDEKRRQEGLTIERPRSALHSGDFTPDEPSRDVSPVASAIPDRQCSRQPTNFHNSGHEWLAISRPRDYTPFQFERRRPVVDGPDLTTSALSLLASSISSSFIKQPPTSPLVQSESNDDTDLASPMDGIGIGIGSSFPRHQRRHTLMSSHSGSYGFSPSPVPRQPAPLRSERSFPYQAHQPRRSLTSTPSFLMVASSPQTPVFSRSRPSSYSSDVSPLQHASMVGSYEESILRGRMSTTPSKPLDFMAQIGVLGKGKCKSSLRCPSHVTLSFPAVFYSYANSSNGRSKDEDGPSPYVGQIDLENGLPNLGEDARSKRKVQSRALERKKGEDDSMDTNDWSAETSDRDVRKGRRGRRRSGSPKAPPGGSYRIPEMGQIQIIIKNPNKTAVKLFLVPYDLSGMEPGTKTFIRQRSYSNGPIIENLPSLKDAGATDKPILRYLVHLHVCCPSRGRFYLYKSIRVVFANRVPDGKEKLQNEIKVPEPRFTPYKPVRVMHPPITGTGPGASLAADKAFRRRSSGICFGAANLALGAVEGAAPPNLPHQPFAFSFDADRVPIEPVPFRGSLGASGHHANDGSVPGPANSPSPVSSQGSRPTTQASSDVSNWGPNGQIDKYDKLNKGDVGYGGNAFAGLINGNPSIAESLLSRRLRTLGVRAGHQPPDPETQDDQVSA
ncbi:hypothetical protein F4778DRAFT_755925 [Xylariomycetidae sp. FL2044]|nr:hypothetical protein F4778DRAFT_755925 [Xylariomycetidae sp. FL2044]